MTLLRTEELSAGYGPVSVLHDLNLEVHEGEIVVMLGANGAGKTTTMRAVSGTIHRSGTVEFAGHSIQRSSPEAIVRAGIAHVPQGRGTFPELSVDDNLRAGAFTRRDRAGVNADIEQWYTRFPRLRERRAQRAGSLSGGEQQMLAIARGLMSKPSILMLDEPSLGLAPVIVERIGEILSEIQASEGLAVLLAEQNDEWAVLAQAA